MITRLCNTDDWKTLLDRSRNESVLVFKHSTICNISSSVLEEFLQFVDRHRSTRIGLVYVVEDRELSQLISEDIEILHESPQLIAIENQRSVWHASHWGIDLEELERYLAN